MGIQMRAIGAVLAALGLLGVGCADGRVNFGDPMKRENSLIEAQKHYTDLVRWGEIERASDMVDPEQRDAFLSGAPDPKRVRLTDYVVATPRIDEESGTSTVVVTYTAYGLHNPYEVEIEETQEWYREGFANNWRVRSSFQGLDAVQ